MAEPQLGPSCRLPSYHQPLCIRRSEHASADSRGNGRRALLEPCFHLLMMVQLCLESGQPAESNSAALIYVKPVLLVLITECRLLTAMKCPASAHAWLSAVQFVVIDWPFTSLAVGRFEKYSIQAIVQLIDTSLQECNDSCRQGYSSPLRPTRQSL